MTGAVQPRRGGAGECMRQRRRAALGVGASVGDGRSRAGPGGVVHDRQLLAARAAGRAGVLVVVTLTLPVRANRLFSQHICVCCVCVCVGCCVLCVGCVLRRASSDGGAQQRDKQERDHEPRLCSLFVACVVCCVLCVLCVCVSSQVARVDTWWWGVAPLQTRCRWARDCSNRGCCCMRAC